MKATGKAQNGQPDQYLSVDQTCSQFTLSRSTFYRLLRDAGSGLNELIVRVPPRTGRIRVPARGFEEWLRGQSRAG